MVVVWVVISTTDCNPQHRITSIATLLAPPTFKWKLPPCEGESGIKPDDQEALDNFEDYVTSTKVYFKCLIVIKEAHEMSEELQADLDNLERAKRDEPHKNYSMSIERMTDIYKELRTTLHKSTIPKDHPLKTSVTDLSSRLNRLSMEDKPALPPTIVTTPPVAASKTVQMPKMELPSFRGDLMKWATFWSEFSAAMASHPELTVANKLDYLYTAIKDPKTVPLIESGLES